MWRGWQFYTGMVVGGCTVVLAVTWGGLVLYVEDGAGRRVVAVTSDYR